MANQTTQHGLGLLRTLLARGTSHQIAVSNVAQSLHTQRHIIGAALARHAPSGITATADACSTSELPSTSGRSIAAAGIHSRSLGRYAASISSTRQLSTDAKDESIPQWLFSTIRSVPGKIRSLLPGETRLVMICAERSASKLRPGAAWSASHCQSWAATCLHDGCSCS